MFNLSSFQSTLIDQPYYIILEVKPHANPVSELVSAFHIHDNKPVATYQYRKVTFQEEYKELTDYYQKTLKPFKGSKIR